MHSPLGDWQAGTQAGGGPLSPRGGDEEGGTENGVPRRRAPVRQQHLLEDSRAGRHHPGQAAAAGAELNAAERRRLAKVVDKPVAVLPEDVARPAAGQRWRRAAVQSAVGIDERTRRQRNSCPSTQRHRCRTRSRNVAARLRKRASKTEPAQTVPPSPSPKASSTWSGVSPSLVSSRVRAGGFTTAAHMRAFSFTPSKS